MKTFLKIEISDDGIANVDFDSRGGLEAKRLVKAILELMSRSPLFTSIIMSAAVTNTLSPDSTKNGRES